jgi:L-ascorbate metabolism protein UlaG (beta-lactamase superfamily)
MMKVTKYDHACLVIEDQGQQLVIDPGSFVQSKLTDLKQVVGIVVTHVHQDHFDSDHLNAIFKNNPDAQLFSTQEVADEYTDHAVTVVTGGHEAKVGNFKLTFYGGKHAVIHPSFPQNENVGVMVNQRLYYPGDSFSAPGVPVEVLALPVSAPWMKLAEAMDFAVAVKPKNIFPTHNALNSEIAEGLAESIVGGFVKQQGAAYKHIPVGESAEF